MDLLSLSPLPVASLIWRHGQGSWIQTVVCKCTFELCPGLARTVQRQYPICDRDRFLEDDPNRSVYAPGDLAPFKRRVDVTLVGSAFAPGGHSVERLVARLRLGPLRKGIEVLPERQWVDGKWRAGPAFARVPLWYELAAGGPGTDNPVGIPGQRSPRLPRIVPEGFDPTSSGPIPTAGFGPIGALWPSRLARLGELGEAWSETRWHDRPLPRDFDAEYFNAAPADQQLDRLAPHLVLENLHPGHPVLETYLPGLQPKAIVERRPGEQEELEMEADSVWIDTERAVWAITWRTQVVLEGRDQPGRVLVAIENVEQDRPTPTPAPAATPRPTPTPPTASARDTEPPQAPVVLRSLGQQEEHTPTGVHEDAAELTVDALSPSLSNDYPAWLRTPPPPRAGGSLPAPAAVAVPAAPPETGLRPFPATPGSLEVGPPAAPREAERPRPPTPPPRAVPPPRGERLPPGAPGSTPPPAVTSARGERPTPTAPAAPASPSPPAVAPPRGERQAPASPAPLPAPLPREQVAPEHQAVELVWFEQGRPAALRQHWGELLGPVPGEAEGRSEPWRAEALLAGARRDAFAVL
ncbi:MAG: DUF2169 domain-containing protein, partial [Deltaproteobacteria bacterium]|nr:DUF2169 domain-containing protein [Deltaproteobacteria bacterium]